MTAVVSFASIVGVGAIVRTRFEPDGWYWRLPKHC